MKEDNIKKFILKATPIAIFLVFSLISIILLFVASEMFCTSVESSKLIGSVIQERLLLNLKIIETLGLSLALLTLIYGIGYRYIYNNVFGCFAILAGVIVLLFWAF